jgi:predicted NAD/FAD-binding protein
VSLGRVAIVGSGIAGMSAAYFLRDHAAITVFEKEPRIGGHTHTVDIDGKSFDTGFMVYNEVTYPHLTRLFSQLGVRTQPTDMSFSVQVLSKNLEYSGSSLNHLFSQRRNLFRPSFWKFLSRIHRFNETAFSLISDSSSAAMTLREFVLENDFGEDFLEDFLVPMSSAVWSTPRDRMMDFPAQTLVRFFHNHGFLGLHTQHPWRTVCGGSRSYRDLLIQSFRDCIRTGDPVRSVRGVGAGVEAITHSGKAEIFDRVIFACHADEALALIQEPTELERSLLSCFEYQANPTVVHTDESVMPKRKLAWSSWNYRVEASGRASTHYWMNRLQNLSGSTQFFVSLNDPDQIDPAHVKMRLNYFHPIFSRQAVAAQQKLPSLNAQGETTRRFFCGSYFKYGFHEDALAASVGLCTQLLKRAPSGMMV